MLIEQFACTSKQNEDAHEKNKKTETLQALFWFIKCINIL